jgi:hypothetical protein
MWRTIVQPIREERLHLTPQGFRRIRNAGAGKCFNKRNHAFPRSFAI